MKHEGYALKIDTRKFFSDSPVTDAEVYAVKCITEAMKKGGVPEGGEYWQTVVRRTTDLLKYHREEVRSMYKASKKMLRDWIVKESGAAQFAAFTKMMRIGLTGDVMHDMKILEEVSRR